MHLRYLAMKTAGLKEIKNRLSAYLRMVERRDRVTVTRRDRVVADLRPAAPVPPVISDSVLPSIPSS